MFHSQNVFSLQLCKCFLAQLGLQPFQVSNESLNLRLQPGTILFHILSVGSPSFSFSPFVPTGHPSLCAFIFGFCNFLCSASSFSQQQLFQLLPTPFPPPSLAQLDQLTAILASSDLKMPSLRKH